MHSLYLLAAIISAASAALLSASPLEHQLIKYELLVDMMQGRVAAECPEDVWQIKHVKRAAKTSKVAITEPELQLENLKSLYSHFLSMLSQCKTNAAKAAALKEKARASAAKAKAKAAAAAKAKADALAREETSTAKSATTPVRG